jgi:SNF family Na+-dependent transporter
VLQQSDSINQFEGIIPSLFCLYLLSMLICHFVIKDGAKTSGKIVMVTATAPYVILVILVLRGLFLEGAMGGLSFLFKPKWESLLNYNVWIDATVQVFYQMSIGTGNIINISTAKPRREDILKSVILVPIGLVICGLLSAMTIFIYLSHFCVLSGYEIGDPSLSLAGMELSFNVLPQALLLLPLPNLWLFIFFLAMVLLGIDSQFGMMEALYCYVRDELKNRELSLLGVKIDAKRGQVLMLMLICIGCPTLSSHAGIYYLEFYDFFLSNIPFTAWVLTELYFFVHVVPFGELTGAIARYTKVPTPWIIEYCLKSYWLPGLLLANLFFATWNQLFIWRKYTFWFGLLGWTITAYPFVLIYLRLRKEWPGWSQLKVTYS